MIVVPEFLKYILELLEVDIDFNEKDFDSKMLMFQLRIYAT